MCVVVHKTLKDKLTLLQYTLNTIPEGLKDKNKSKKEFIYDKNLENIYYNLILYRKVNPIQPQYLYFFRSITTIR